MRKSKYAYSDPEKLPKDPEAAIAQGIRLFVGGEVCRKGHLPAVKVISSLHPLKWGCYECRKERDRVKKSRVRESEESRERINEMVAAANRKRYWGDAAYRESLLSAQKKGRMVTKCASYGITMGDYEQMLQQQGGVCAICGEPETATHGNGVVRSLHIDHCHSSRKVRGLLCAKCNIGLGAFNDTPRLLEGAIAYLQRAETLQAAVTPLQQLPFALEFPINRKMWEPLSAVQKDILVDALFSHYRKEGFPYHPTPTAEGLAEELRKATQYIDSTPVIVGGDIRQTMHLLGAAWAFFPHAYSVVCNGRKTPMGVFHDDLLFRHALHKRLKIGTYLSNGGVRKMLMSLSGVQSVSNFRPTAAAAIMRRFCGSNGTVLDPCAGWGGRLLGAELAGVGYVGVEPSTQTYQGLMELNAMLPNQDRHTVVNACAEEYQCDRDVDLVFTSPPYFDCEKYADEATQSWVRYSTTEQWFGEFLIPMLKNAISPLRSGGHLALNIADVATYPTLTRDFMVWMTARSDMVFVEELRLVLSKGFTKEQKYEPVFVFRKVS